MSTKPRPHIIVVGAGVIGASIAWHLTRHEVGADVTVVAQDIGGTATPCSFAWLNASWHNPRPYYDFRRRSMEGWRRLAEELPEVSNVLRWCGSLSWDMPPDELAKYLKEHSAWGYDIHRAERAEIHALEPTLSAEVLPPEWGLRVGEEGAVEADQAARAMVNAAQERGAKVVHATVTNLIWEQEPNSKGTGSKGTGSKVTGSKVTGIVLSSSETLLADHVVLAAGVACVDLCTTAGITVPLKTPAPAGLLVHSKPLRKRILHHVVYNPQGHMRQTADGRILAGSDFVGGDPGPDPLATARAQLEKAKMCFQPEERETLELDYFTVGYRPQPEDGLPILGETGLEGLSLAVMHSGVTNAALVGEILAETVLTGKADPALEIFSLKRFKQGRR
ncbi:hypothetical protein M406DRAFT_354338 [Cryphonectria parasitica EP155]|uniref:FAD dependent oxidoreductase domain-containing protein n=1 Tax=Cryphonectria parasitica (strain ATCC 38755 / EP155) TaxID=660469 RepID=A0A9P4YBC5_CRYP1|nr:uncharacterized protein M406DRAFT_354338 [Cryphonectria parasitica EP155]KAF3770236.1 hypothetical protein M406DRAFT_354338 [Cryphonectria parasitica EP155]